MKETKAKKQPIIKKLRINYSNTSQDYWTAGMISIKGYDIEIPPKFNIETLDEAVANIKQRITQAALAFTEEKIEIK